MKKILLYLSIYTTSQLSAQTPVMVKDIYPGSTGAFKNLKANMHVLGNRLLFLGHPKKSYNSLWLSDGTEQGTNSILQVDSLGNGNGGNIVWVEDTIAYYYGNVDSLGYELWKTDGTAAGTTLVKDINPGKNTSIWNTPAMIRLGNKYYFNALDSATGEELYVTDGTAANTTLVKDINPGIASSSPASFCLLGSKMLFSAKGPNGFELWITDGTTNGTYELKDIFPGTDNSLPMYLSEFNNELFFQAYTPATGRELWKTDGTAVGTVLVKDINAGNKNSEVGQFVKLGNKLLFCAVTQANGLEIWTSDGTEAGTTALAVNNPSSVPQAPQLYNSIIYKNKVYFFANHNSSGEELWETDGTEQGTNFIQKFNSQNLTFYEPQFTVVNDELYFLSFEGDGTNELEIYKTDGTAASLVMLPKINPTRYSGGSYNTQLVAIGNTIFLTANNGIHGDELWKIEVPATYIQNINPALGIRLYPNPTNTHTFKLQFDATQADEATINVTDLAGKSIYTEKLSELPFMKSITLAETAKGFYLVKVSTNKGSITKQLIVE